MWAAMESSRPTVFVNNNDEGRDRVLKGKRQYAYLMESTMLEFFTERYCDLVQIGQYYTFLFIDIYSSRFANSNLNLNYESHSQC